MSCLVKSWPSLKSGITLCVYTAHCIATRPPEHTFPMSKLNYQPDSSHISDKRTAPTSIRALVNPTNEELIGTVLPYFPMAEPPPPDLLTTNWGSASIIGSGMFYAVQTVDGIVALHGGTALRNACKQLPIHESVELIGGGGNQSGGFGSVRCPVGSAVITDAFGDAITKNYQLIVHTVPPLWPGVGGSKLKEESAIFLLRSCYYEAFNSGFSAGASTVTTPFIGAGSRKAPESRAIDCAVKGVLDVMRSCYNSSKIKRLDLPKLTAEFVLQDPRIAEQLVKAIDHELEACVFFR